MQTQSHSLTFKMNKAEERLIQTEFLKAFILECMNQTMIKKGSRIFIKPVKAQIESSPSIIQRREIREIPQPQIIPVRQIPRQAIQIQNNPMRTRMPILLPNKAKPMVRQMSPVNQQFQAPTQSTPPILGMEKINPLLADPAVISVECPGPDRPILINKSGRVQTSSIIMNTEEINKLMAEISKITRIPLIQGIFKAAFGKYIISAVVSDFVGTRFIIQKKNPFMLMQ